MRTIRNLVFEIIVGHIMSAANTHATFAASDRRRAIVAVTPKSVALDR